jgi:hypothetical protein
VNSRGVLRSETARPENLCALAVRVPGLKHCHVSRVACGDPSAFLASAPTKLSPVEQVHEIGV